MKRLLIAAAIAFAPLGGSAFAPIVVADPAPPCGVPGQPACAGPMPPELRCALDAWRTWMPCNWVNPHNKVAQGTPGSM